MEVHRPLRHLAHFFTYVRGTYVRGYPRALPRENLTATRRACARSGGRGL